MENFKWLSTEYDLGWTMQNTSDPRFTSELNYLRFYLPNIFPSLDKVILLDHDVVVQKDLSGLWHVDMKGKVNVAVETCKESEVSFLRMDTFINFSDPLIADKFDNKACTWAFGMNVFDLRRWREENLTALYHKYLRLVRKSILVALVACYYFSWRGQLFLRVCVLAVTIYLVYNHQNVLIISSCPAFCRYFRLQFF